MKFGKSKPGPAAIAAAEWWAEQVGSPVFRFTDDSGDAKERDVAAMTSMMATMISSKHPVSDEQGQRFVDALAPVIQEKLGGYGVTLDVDYGPDGDLSDAAKAAGIDLSRFPWKTTMWVHEDYVTASRGYRAASRLIWASEEWLANRPVCGSQKWEETGEYDPGYHGEPFKCSLPMYHEESHRYDQPISLCRTCGGTEDSYGVHADQGWGNKWHPFDGVAPGERPKLPVTS